MKMHLEAFVMMKKILYSMPALVMVAGLALIREMLEVQDRKSLQVQLFLSGLLYRSVQTDRGHCAIPAAGKMPAQRGCVTENCADER